MKKRFLSVILCLCMAAGMLPVIMPTAQAANAGVADKLNALRSKYPDGAYWNHYVAASNLDGDSLLASRNEAFAESVTWSNCATHSASARVGQYDCNYFDGGIQCWGFARRVFYEVFGVRCSALSRNYNPASVQVGDYVRFGSDSNGHSVVVIARSGNTVTVVECNYGSNCRIKWDRKLDITADFAYSYHAPNYDEINVSYPTGAKDLGSDFYAYISYPNGNLNLENRNNNVQTAEKKPSDPRQIWHFIRLGDGTYNIVNMYDGRYLDVLNGGGSGTNVWACTGNGDAPQKWKIVEDAYGMSEAYNLVISYNNSLALDVNNADKGSGTNVQIWDRNATVAQAFRITKISNVSSTLAYNLGTDFYAQISYNGYYMEASGVITEDGHNMDIHMTKTSKPNDPKQVWHFQRESTGAYTIVNEYKGWYMDVPGANAYNKAKVRLWCDDPSNTIPGRRWYLQLSPGDSSYRLVSAIRYPGELYSMDIPGGNMYEGAAIEIYQANENPWQYFKINKVSYNPELVITPSYIITTIASPAAGGTVTGGGSYLINTTVTVAAAPKEGYVFKGWTENGSTVSTSTIYRFDISKSRDLTAVFEKKDAATSVTAWPAASAVNYGQTLASSILSGGKANVIGAFQWKDSSAIPKAGQTHDVTFIPSEAVKYDTVSGKLPVTVNRSAPALSVSAYQSGMSVMVNASASNPYNAALTDVPAPTITYRIGNGTVQRMTGRSFTIPEGTANGTVITITASTAENGNYRAAEKSTALTVLNAVSGTSYHVLTTSGSDLGGSVSIQPSSAKQGETVMITATPRSGYRLGTVTAADASGAAVWLTSLGSGRYMLTMPGSNVTLDVAFEATQDSWVNPFSDIVEGAWYYDAVKFVSQNGLMNGSDGVFDHSGNLSRAMIAQILYNKEGRPPVAGGQMFNDVAGNAWYADAVSWAASQKLILGDEKGLFSPNQPITREQLAVVLWRHAGSQASSGGTLNFTDAGRVSGYAQEAVKWAVKNGIISGKGGGVLDPQGPATRAQVAQMLKNYLDK